MSRETSELSSRLRQNDLREVAFSLRHDSADAETSESVISYRRGQEDFVTSRFRDWRSAVVIGLRTNIRRGRMLCVFNIGVNTTVNVDISPRKSTCTEELGEEYSVIKLFTESTGWGVAMCSKMEWRRK
jgi:hypothetical protein